MFQFRLSNTNPPCRGFIFKIWAFLRFVCASGTRLDPRLRKPARCVLLPLIEASPERDIMLDLRGQKLLVVVLS